MFQGTTIEQLINSVVRAEQHAREQQGRQQDLQDYPVRRMELQELVEVA